MAPGARSCACSPPENRCGILLRCDRCSSGCRASGADRRGVGRPARAAQLDDDRRRGAGHRRRLRHHGRHRGMARHLVPSRARRRPARRRQARRPARPPSVRARRACDLRGRVARRCAGAVARVPDRVPRAAGRLGRGRLPERRRSHPRARPGGSSRRSIRDRGRLDRAGRRPRAAHRRRARGGRRLARHLPRQHPVRRSRARDRLASGAAASRRRRDDRVRLARGCTARDRPDRVGAPRDRGWPRPGDARPGNPAPARARRCADLVGAAASRSCLPAALLRDPPVRRRQRRHLLQQPCVLHRPACDPDPAHPPPRVVEPPGRARACAAVGPDDRVLADRRPSRRPLRPAPAVGRRVRRPHGRFAAARPRCRA